MNGYEEDSEGLPPTRVREVLTAENGLWVVRLVNEPDRLRSVVVLRSLLALDIKTATPMLRGQSRSLWSGTQVECLWLKEHLGRARIFVEVASAADRHANQPT